MIILDVDTLVIVGAKYAVFPATEEDHPDVPLT
jgi:hypothetical protein